MATDTGLDPTIQRSNLASFMLGQFRRARENRQHIQDKWNINHAAMTSDPDQDPLGTWKISEKSAEWMSDTFFDLTRQKAITAHSIGTDTVLRGGKVPISLQPDERVVSMPPKSMQQDGGDTPIDRITEANENLLESQLRRTKAAKQLDMAFASGAEYGEYYLKTFVVDLEDKYWDTVGIDQESGSMIYDEVIKYQSTKAVENKSVWSMFRDIEVDDIQEGEYLFELSFVTIGDLFEQRENPLFSAAAIDRVIERNKSRTADDTSYGGRNFIDDESYIPPELRSLQNRERTLELLEGWSRVPREMAEEFEARFLEEQLGETLNATEDSEIDFDETEPSDRQAVSEQEAMGEDSFEELNTADSLDYGLDDGDRVEAFAMIVDGEIVALQLDPGPRPYFREVWDLNLDGTYGLGIADALKFEQKVLNGMIRSYENDLKILTQIILGAKRENLNSDIEPAIEKGFTIIDVDPDADGGINESIEQLNFTDVTGSIMNGITMFMQFADLSSNIPRIQQGQQSDNAQTAFEVSQRLAQAGKYLGAVVRRFDGAIEWLGQEMYNYNMGNPDLEVAKAPFLVKALGFSSFENEFVRLQKLLQLFQIVMSNPEIAPQIRWRWFIEEIAKALDVDPGQFLKSQDEMAQEAEAAQNSQVAQLQAQAAQLELELKQAEGEQKRAETAKTIADTSKVQADETTGKAKAIAELEKMVQDMAIDRRNAAGDVAGAVPQTTASPA